MPPNQQFQSTPQPTQDSQPNIQQPQIDPRQTPSQPAAPQKKSKKGLFLGISASVIMLALLACNILQFIENSKTSDQLSTAKEDIVKLKDQLIAHEIEPNETETEISDGGSINQPNNIPSLHEQLVAARCQDETDSGQKNKCTQEIAAASEDMIKDSSFAPYQTIIVPLEKIAGEPYEAGVFSLFFYRRGEADRWHFATTSQGENGEASTSDPALYCDQLYGEGIRAFADRNCKYQDAAHQVHTINVKDYYRLLWW